MHSMPLISIIILITIFSSIILSAPPQTYLQAYMDKDEVLVKEAETILTNMFQIDMARYRLDTVNFNGANTHDNITIENYLIVFKDKNNNTLITDVYLMHGEIIRIEIIGPPPTNNYRRNTQLTIKHSDKGVIISGKTIGIILNNTIKTIDKVYGWLSYPVQEMLKNIQQTLGSTTIVLSRKTCYEYKLIPAENYTFSLHIETSEDNEAEELFISLWRTLSLPLNTTYMRSVVYIHYYILNNRLYCTMFSYSPLIPRAKIIVPEKLHEISINTVIGVSRRILEEYLRRTSITDYEILSIKPLWIGINEYTQNWSLIIIPNVNLTLEATVKTGSETKHYIIYLNLDTMKGFVKGEYIPIKQAEEHQGTTTLAHTSKSETYEHTLLVFAVAAILVIIGIYLYIARRKMIR
ncbi:MAG: hypothetical protein GXO43_06260 [Crenarchaeota archaeon]|nr:hypothetical protein [Thermoproteota archaeon]